MNWRIGTSVYGPGDRRGRLVTLPAKRTPPHLLMPGNIDQHGTIDTTRIREELEYRELVTQADAIRRTIE